jgi:FAD/FMN-containing dehydrogenase
MVLFGGLPKLILQVDFAGDNPFELKGKIAYLREVLAPLHPKTRIAVDKQEQKYWLIRRESFNLLRQKIHNMHTAPFIDDFVINPHDIAKVLPEISNIVKHHKGFIFTIAGHVGNGNFHIIPLTNIQKKSVRDAIPVIAEKVYKIVHEHHGSITGEHNDGLVRTPYLREMYGERMIELFEQTKNIFDSQNIFNPRKKVHGSMEFALSHIRQNW